MTAGDRETATAALLERIAECYDWRVPPDRKLKLWSDVSPGERPCCFLYEGGGETTAHGSGLRPTRTVDLRLYVYTDAESPDAPQPPAAQINAIIAAVEAGLAPAGPDLALGRNTLGGAAYWVRIEGRTVKDPGDLDGDGIIVVPLRLTLP